MSKKEPEIREIAMIMWKLSMSMEARGGLLNDYNGRLRVVTIYIPLSGSQYSALLSRLKELDGPYYEYKNCEITENSLLDSICLGNVIFKGDRWIKEMHLHVYRSLGSRRFLKVTVHCNETCNHFAKFPQLLCEYDYMLSKNPHAKHTYFNTDIFTNSGTDKNQAMTHLNHAAYRHIRYYYQGIIASLLMLPNSSLWPIAFIHEVNKHVDPLRDRGVRCSNYIIEREGQKGLICAYSDLNPFFEGNIIELYFPKGSSNLLRDMQYDRYWKSLFYYYMAENLELEEISKLASNPLLITRAIQREREYNHAAIFLSRVKSDRQDGMSMDERTFDKAIMKSFSNLHLQNESFIKHVSALIQLISTLMIPLLSIVISVLLSR